MSPRRIVAKPLSALAVLAAQIIWAGHRRDLPSLQNQDPSGVFGDPAAPRLRVVALGDSTVTSPGVEPLEACWPQRIARRMAAAYLVEFRSVAVGGSKAYNVLHDQVPRALALRPHVCIVSVGGNDALRGTPVARFEREYDAILRALTARVPYIAVSGVGDLGSIPRLPALARSISRVRGRAVDGAIRRVVHNHPGVVKTDTWSPGWDEFNTNPAAIFAADQFHASAYGHRVYTAAMLPAIDVLLARLQQQTDSELG